MYLSTKLQDITSKRTVNIILTDVRWPSRFHHGEED